MQSFFEEFDRWRRMQGMVLDAMALRPPETPYHVVHSAAGVALRRYGSDSQAGPLVLIVPAPIKRPYIWDLAPEVSAVRFCIDHGARVYLADWRPAPAHYGLAEYAGRLILDCLDAAGAGRAVLLGHSLGGLFAALFAALHPERVQGLGLLAAPLRFAEATPVFGAMVARLQADALPDALPGSFLSAASANAAPRVFGSERLLDALLSAGDPVGLRTHFLVERWTLDEFALPRQLVVELATRIVREDLFMRGLLEIGGRIAAPSRVTAPLLCVIDPRCTLVPPEAVMPFVDAVASREKIVLHYEGDVGVALQHVGPLVGRRAHLHLWPRIVEWIAKTWTH
jgi:polyhydroxyalkanoate synthase subunit PhaC